MLPDGNVPKKSRPSDLGTFPSGNTFRVTKSMSCKKVEVVGATWGRFRPVTRLG